MYFNIDNQLIIDNYNDVIVIPIMNRIHYNKQKQSL